MFQLNELCTEREHLFPLRTHPRKSATSHSGKISSLTPMGRNRRGKKREGPRGGRHLVRELVVPVALPGLRVHFPHPPRTLHGSLLYVLAIVVPYVVLSVLLYGASTQRRRSHVRSLSARFEFSVASGRFITGKAESSRRFSCFSSRTLFKRQARNRKGCGAGQAVTARPTRSSSRPGSRTSERGRSAKNETA